MRNAFPGIGPEKERLAKAGIDIEASFRNWMGELTGKQGTELDELIDRGNKEGGKVFDREAKKDADTRLRAPLTPRETEILQGFANGLSREALAYHEHISLETVKSHAKNIIDKSLALNMTHAVAIGLREGIIE